MKKNKAIDTAFAVCAAIAGMSTVGVCTALGAGIFEEHVIYDDVTQQSIPHSKFDYKVNESGQTYGNGMDAMYVEDMPDLISVVGDHGVIGYIYAIESYGDAPSSPEEALKIQQSIEDGTYVPKVYIVYDSDGKTAIDTFTETVCQAKQLFE